MQTTAQPVSITSYLHSGNISTIQQSMQPTKHSGTEPGDNIIYQPDAITSWSDGSALQRAQVSGVM
jgi:hypothetical protein